MFNQGGYREGNMKIFREVFTEFIFRAFQKGYHSWI